MKFKFVETKSKIKGINILLFILKQKIVAVAGRKKYWKRRFSDQSVAQYL